MTFETCAKKICEQNANKNNRHREKIHNKQRNYLLYRHKRKVHFYGNVQVNVLATEIQNNHGVKWFELEFTNIIIVVLDVHNKRKEKILPIE